MQHTNTYEQGTTELQSPFEDIRQAVEYPERLAAAINYVRHQETWWTANATTTKGRIINGFGRTKAQAGLDLNSKLNN